MVLLHKIYQMTSLMSAINSPTSGTFLSLTKHKARVDPSEVQTVFECLPAVSPEFIFGEWEAHLLATGHPSDPKAAALLPIFKNFRSRTSVDKYSLVGGEKKHLPGWGNLFVGFYYNIVFASRYHNVGATNV